MKNYRFELGLAALFLAIFVGALAFWGDWAGGRMSHQEVDEYLVVIDENLEWPDPMKSYMMQSLKEWGYADDGKQSAYKLMGAHTNLIPMTPQWIFPDMRLATGAVLLILFFAVAWIRAVRRARD